MTFPPEPLVQIQNNFTEMFLMMASTTRDETKNMHVTVCMLAILHVLLSSSGIPQHIFSNVISQEHHQSVKRPGSRSVSPFWVQSVCKGNQQSPDVARSVVAVSTLLNYLP